MRQWIFDCNLSSKDVKVLDIENDFWKDMLTAWCEYNYGKKKNG